MNPARRRRHDGGPEPAAGWTVAELRRCYRYGCRHDDCTDGHRAYMADRRRQRLYGRADEHATVDSTAIRVYLDRLHRHYGTWDAVHRALDMTEQAQLHRRPRVRQRTADRVRTHALEVLRSVPQDAARVRRR